MHPSHAAGNYAFRCKDYAKAIEYYTKALEDDIGLTDTTTRSIINSNKYVMLVMPGGGTLSNKHSDVCGTSHRAAAWLKLGNFNAALDDAQRATQLDPRWVGLVMYRALCTCIVCFVHAFQNVFSMPFSGMGYACTLTCIFYHNTNVHTHYHHQQQYSNGKAWYRQACALAALDHTKEAHTAALHAAQHVPQPHADVDRLLHALTISDGKSATGGGKNETAVPASAQACVSSPNSNPKNTSNTDNTINSGATTTTITTPNPHLLQSLLPPLFQDSIFIPTPHGHQYNLMILLHGLGDTQQPFADLARSMMLPDTASLACGGPCVVPETGGRSWFAVEWVDEEEGDGCSVEVGHFFCVVGGGSGGCVCGYTCL